MISYNLNETLSTCPEGKITEYMLYPSSAILYGVFAVTTFTFGLFIILKYNSVKVWDKSVSPLYISNTLWIIYYLAMFARASCNTIRYSLKSTNVQVDSSLFQANLVLQGIAAFALSLTINHQRRYRSSAPAHTTSASPTDKDPLLAKSESGWLKAISILEILFALFFLIYLVFLYLALIKGSVFREIFLAAFILQRLPILIMMLAIVIQSSTEGPTRKSKIVFFFAAIFHLVNDLPTFIWIQILPVGCPIVIASYLDLVSLLNFISIILFFFFIRWEFLRNMEEVIWDNVNQIQTTFDFRRF